MIWPDGVNPPYICVSQLSGRELADLLLSLLSVGQVHWRGLRDSGVPDLDFASPRVVPVSCRPEFYMG